MIYFDSAASYPVLPSVLKELEKRFKELHGNPSSSHMLGEEASQTVESTRELIANEIGAMPSEIIFTSGATESNNLALKGHFSLPANIHRKQLVISSIEHKCVHAIADFLSRNHDIQVAVVQPNREGVITVENLSKVVSPETSLISVMHVNNELGTVNPIEEIGEYCLDNNIKLHTDAAQSFLKAPIDVDDMNIDYLSLSAHKIGGPKGIGALYIRDRRDIDVEPVIHGAGQEDGLRGGTLPGPIIAGFGMAIGQFPNEYTKLCLLDHKDRLLNELKKLEVPFQTNGESIPSIISLTLPRTDVPQLIRSTYYDLALATGSACSSKEIEASHVLMAIGMHRELAEKTLRISFHHELTAQDIRLLADNIRRHSI